MFQDHFQANEKGKFVVVVVELVYPKVFQLISPFTNPDTR